MAITEIPPPPSADRLAALPVPTGRTMHAQEEARSLTPGGTQSTKHPVTQPIPRTLPQVSLPACSHPNLSPVDPPAKRICTKEAPQHISAASGSSTPLPKAAMSHIVRPPPPPASPPPQREPQQPQQLQQRKKLKLQLQPGWQEQRQQWQH